MLTGLRAAPAALILLIALPLLRYAPAVHAGRLIRTAISGLLMVTWFPTGSPSRWRSRTRHGDRPPQHLAVFIILAERYVYGKRVTKAMLLAW